MGQPAQVGLEEPDLGLREGNDLGRLKAHLGPPEWVAGMPVPLTNASCSSRPGP